MTVRIANFVMSIILLLYYYRNWDFLVYIPNIKRHINRNLDTNEPSYFTVGLYDRECKFP